MFVCFLVNGLQILQFMSQMETVFKITIVPLYLIDYEEADRALLRSFPNDNNSNSNNTFNRLL